MSDQILTVPALLWWRLLRDLYKRGEQRRESGAFLLGKRNGNHDTVREFICYDELDLHALDSGIVVFDGSGFSRLWKHCRKTGLTVLADIHTHGNNNCL